METITRLIVPSVIRRVSDIEGIALDLARWDATDAANDFNTLIAEAQTVEQLADIKAALDEGIGALLSSEQVLIRRRELLAHEFDETDLALGRD